MTTLADLALARGEFPITAHMEKWRRSGSNMDLDCLEIAIDAMFDDLESGKRSDGRGRLRPSKIGHPCPRAQAFSYFGAEQGEKPDWVAEKAKGGSLAHYWFQAEAMSAGALTDIEVQIEIPQWRLRGQLDGLIVDGSVFELKTISTDKYNGRFKGWIPVSKWESPKLDHIKQTNAYMLATGAESASIVYMDRGEQAFREFRIHRDEKLLDEMNEMVEDLLDQADDGELPERLFGCEMLQDGYDPDEHSTLEVNSWLDGMKWCDYKDICRLADREVWSV